MSTEALQLELIAVKQQLAQAQLIQDKSDTANKFAENAQAKLLEQMEKNYTIANRVQAEKAKRQESDHYIKGLRDQMREATTRAMRVASELEREKKKNTELRNQMARSKKNKLERLRPYNYDDDSDLEQDDEGKYSKRRRSNVAVIIVRIVFISSFLFYCLLLNYSFQTNPNRITNCFKLFSLLQLYNYIAPASLF
jgi:hypothetical protein